MILQNGVQEEITWQAGKFVTNGNMTKLKMIIAADRCNGQEVKFEKWMNEIYPEIETSIENTLNGGVVCF